MNQLMERPAELTELQWQDFQEIARYRTQTLELLLRHRQESRDALRIRLERACRQGWLAKTPLTGGEACYALGTRGQRLMQMHHRPGFPFSTDGLLQHMAIALFCTLTGFHRLLPGEFYDKFPSAYRHGLPSQNYCLDRADEERVYWALVDHASEPKRFPEKVARVVSKRLGLAGFDEMFCAGKFGIVIITALPDKKRQIERALDNDAPMSVPVSVVSIPPLLQFFVG